MTASPDAMKLVAPAVVLDHITRAVPSGCKENIIIIGSLAAGYHFFADDPDMMVRTKDADCLLSPRIHAVTAGVNIAERLLEKGWRFREDERWPTPGTAATPMDQLPVVRLYPPSASDWFIELIAVPEPTDPATEDWTRLVTTRGQFALRSFPYLGLASFEPVMTRLGLQVARPEMMALANLLEHPRIRPETMGGLIGGREIKRSNKDLGRVIAIAILSVARDEDSLLGWVPEWKRALEQLFPERWRELASRCGSGLRELLESPNDLEEARITCEFGLLALRPPTASQLRIAGRRLIQDTVELVERGENATP